MDAHGQHAGLIREAETVKFYRGAILGLGRRLPAADADLDHLLAELVAAHNDLAFTPIVFAALATGRRVEARHLVAGAALFPGPDTMLSAAWHCAGAVGEALVGAVKGGLMGSEREAAALTGAAAWTKSHPDFPMPAELVTRARLLAREHSCNPLVLDTLMVLANLVGDEGLKSVLKGYGVAEHPLAEKPFLEHLLPPAGRSPLERVPESPPPVALSGFTVHRAVERIGRNEPCPCGSGKKYKKCCFEKDRARLLDSSAVPGLTQAELRQQPELGLTRQRLEVMRSYELCKLDPVKVPPSLRLPYSERLVVFGLLEEAVSALEKWPFELQARWIWDMLAYEVTRRGSKPLLERLLRLNPQGLESHAHSRLAAELLLAGEEGRQQLDLVEAAALRALGDEKTTLAMVELAYSLLDWRPALGIIAARCAIPMAHPIEGETLLEELLKARDKLNLPPDDPMCDFIDEKLFPEDEPAEEDSAELAKARRELQAKVREVRKLQKELDGLSRELDKRESRAEPAPATPRRGPPRPPQPPAPAETAPQPRPSGLPESEGKALRERIESLKTLLKERHNERNLLRRELNAAQAQIESLRQTPAAPASIPNAEEAEDRLLNLVELEAKQPLRLPEFPRRFDDLLAGLPSPAARSCLGMTGRLAAGEASAFTGVKRLKALPDVYRQRIGEHYRLLFRLHPGRLEIVDLIHRRDLERKIKSML
jgi:hypothetical protein